jgi:RHS repeat-associated protein
VVARRLLLAGLVSVQGVFLAVPRFLSASGPHPTTPAAICPTLPSGPGPSVSEESNYMVQFSVSVTPDGNWMTWQMNTNGHQSTFTVKNTGTCPDTYSFTKSTTGSISGVTLNPSSATLAAGDSTTVTATYNVGTPGWGVLTLTATGSIGGATDNGFYNVSITGYPAPNVSNAVMNSGSRGVDPFDVTTTHTTPTYQSLGTPRAVTLVYNSSTVKPTPVVRLNVTNTGTPYPNYYSVQVQLASSGVRLHLLNGTDSVFYVAGTSDTSRLVAAIDAKANGLTTGWYNVNVTVTAYYSSSIGSMTVPVRLLVDDETGSLFGAGWRIAGLQRLYTMTGSYAALVTYGDGSMSYFERTCSSCPFISPPGDPTKLLVVGSTYKRVSPDSSAVLFGSTGLMTGIWSGPLNAQVLTVNWSGTQPTSIQDYVGKRFILGYTGSYSQSGKLQTVTDPAGRVTIVWTDAAGQVYKITDPDNLFTTFAYDGSIRLTGITDRANSTSNVTYDAINLLDTTYAPTITDYTGIQKRPTAITRAPERLVWQPSITGATSGTAKAHVRPDTVYGRLIDPIGSVTQAAYDKFGGAVKVIDPLGQVTTVTRDTLGQPTYVRQPNGHASTYTYSGYLLTSNHDSATGQTMNYTYNWALATLATVSGSTTRTDIYYYPSHSGGPLNGLVQRVYVGSTSNNYNAPSGGFVADTFVYGTFGVDSLIKDGAGHTTKFFYSDTAHFRNVIKVVDPLGRTTDSTHYDAVGRPDSVWTPSNFALVKTVLTYDSLNRVTVVKDPLGFTMRYTYGPMTLNRVTDAKGRVYKFVYNPLGWLVAQSDLADTTKADTLKYDVGGRVRTVRTRRSVVDSITLTYDSVGRKLTRLGPDFPVDSLRYDPARRWMVATNTNAYDSLAFDQAGRLSYSLERLAGNSYVLTYTYDSLGRLKTRSAPLNGNQVRYVYNVSGALDTLCAAGSCTAFGARDADNRPHAVTFGTTTAHGWILNLKTDSTHRVVSDSFIPRLSGYSVAPLDTLFAKKFYYDTLGRLTDEWPYGSQYGYGGYQYRYDANGRMLNACNDHTTYVQPIGVVFSCIDEYGEETHPLVSSKSAYRYDSTSNRIDSLANAVIGPGNRVTQFKGYTIAYDLDGDILSKKGADTTLFTWDASGTLKQAERWTSGPPHTILTFAYDALGRRVAKTVAGLTERYVHDGDQVIEDIDGSSGNLKAEYGWTPGVDRLMYVRTPSWTAAAFADPIIGSIRGLAQADLGTTYKQYAAPFWGQVGVDTGFIMRFRLAGAEYDQDSRLYYNRARYYDPQLGRFLSEDPVGLAGGINMYVYAGDDPVDATDPSGTEMRPIGFTCPGVGPSGVRHINFEHPECDSNGGGETGSGPSSGGGAAGPGGGGGGSAPSGQAPNSPPQNQTCPTVPTGPPGANVDNNIRLVQSGLGDGQSWPALQAWWQNLVRKGGVWDYKRRGPNNIYGNFGNFNYGATGAALGYDLNTLLRAAGWVQQTPHGLPGAAWNQLKGGSYGDNPDDPAPIKAGFQYYVNGCYQR